ncbi:hypothetical protein DFO66_106109 [Brevibacterium sanguinis]|uniref:Metal-dependent hydrolase n=2 Tax=Brevibacterium TaxID=1696 RepID=A0A366IJ63_9MICO|nr:MULTISPECIES: metal-dependent hydrolase [Brevibacterium]RBP64710.1 hypothetical protein DFO66_106109 [Brevibacterium sanguinis]RBP71647.1 hypothetical protein DFO65_105252 [Brevibacterium celere]
MYCGGDVYSSADPFATALGTTAGRVTFIGSDEAALALDPDAEDLDGDLLTPGFVHAGLVLAAGAPDPEELAAQGFTHVHALGAAEAVSRFAARAPEGLTVVGYPRARPADLGGAPPAAPDLGGAAAAGVSMTAEELLRLERIPDIGVYLGVSSESELRAVLERLRADAVVAQRHGYRLLLDLDVPEELAGDLGRAGVAITIDPARPQPLAQLLAAGAQVSWAHSHPSPWAAVRDAVIGENGISARAAFNAATRFAHRAAGDPEGGVLAPGARADIVRWQVERLVVQVADPRVAAWSTDPRAGTPGLPELASDVPLPRRVALG